MKIQELNLAAFGPFTERRLVFDQDAGGLHIVYGANEAGKSSALRGLKALLFGIEERTLDNFIHPNDKLRIIGHVQNVKGDELSFARRKGRKNTLLTLDGEALDEQAVSTFLHGVTPELFETLFGIDHQALVQGGQEILEQKGEVGQALFSAALGSHALHAVLGQLDDEADALFRPRGSTQVINSTLKHYSELKKEIRDCSLSSREWDEHCRALGRTTKALKKIQSELEGSRIEVNRLKRIQRVLPKLVRRREFLLELESLSDAVTLPDDFAQRHQQTVSGLETAQAILAKATPRLDGLKKQLEALSISQDLLDQAEKIEELHTRLDGHRKVLQERPHLEVEQKQRLIDAEFLLKEVRPDLEFAEVGKLRAVVARRQSIIELGNKNAVLVERVEQAESSRRETETRLKGVEKDRQELPEKGSSEALRRAIAAGRKLGDMDWALQSAESDFVTLESQCTADLSRLTLWRGVLDDLPGLEVPNREGILYFEGAYDELDKRIQQLRDEQEKVADILKETLLRLDEIQLAGDVPTEESLAETRSGRDQAWRLLRRQWLDGEDVSAEARSLDAEARLPEAFEERMADADELSDRLRREGDRVHAMATLQATEKSVKRQTTDIARQLEACATERRLIDSEWQALWAPCRIQPRTPREMRAWLDDLVKLSDRVKQLNLLRQKSGEMEQIRKTHIQLLNQQLEALGIEGSKSGKLEPVLLECEETAQQIDEIRQKHDALNKEIKILETDLGSLTGEYQSATGSLDEWKAQWWEMIEDFGLPGDASPHQVAGFTEKVRELFAKQNDAEKLQIRIKAIDEDTASFRNQVTDIVSNIATELAGLPAEDAAMHLNSLLSDNRSRETQRQQIAEQLELAEQEIADSNATIRIMSDRLESLCAEADCNNYSQLIEARRKSDRHLKVRAAIDSIEQEIIETGEGATVAEMEMEAEGADSDLLPGRIVKLNNMIDDELEPKRTDLAETKGRQEKELELMDGSDRAATLAEQMQAMLAGIRSDAERYVRVKLAGRVLRDEIERYRKENQGPLIKHASQHFADLTLGSFEGLVADINEKDEPVLAGTRPGGERVTVEGMSSGTRDQLYLALRLASLDKYMESAEPMPFIVDDILVDFDDLRSESALNSLANLAEKTQVILFTHHSKVVEQAKRLHGTALVHEL